jgi:hypothetical protein
MVTEADRTVGGRAGLRTALAMVAGLIGCLSMSATAGAETVTIGTPTASFIGTNSEYSCTCTQYQLVAAGQTEAVPADGVIIGWRVQGNGTLTLQALRPSSGGLSVVGSSSPGQSATGSGVPARPAHIPVLAGDQIGVHLSGNSAQVNNSGSKDPSTTVGVIPDSPSPFPPLTPAGLLFLNADVAITPIVTSISTTSGTTGGGTVVTITGSHLDGSVSVQFGALNASSFTDVSPTEIVASAPAQAAGTVDIRVAGAGDPSATSPADQFTYVASSSNSQGAGNGQGPGGQQTSGGGPRLVLSPLSLSASSFFAAPSGASIAKVTPTGSKLTYSVSAPATTTFVIQSVVPGVLLPALAGAHGIRVCGALTKARLAKKLPKCTRYVALLPHLTHTGLAGTNVVHLSGRLSGHVLAPGSYRLFATATSVATPTVTSAPVTHSFHIVAPQIVASAKPKAHAALPSTGSGATTAPTG